MTLICACDKYGNWCLTRKPEMDYQDSVLTVCGDVIALPYGFARCLPTCEKCLKEITKGNIQ